MVIDKPVKQVIDCPPSARWLTSNPHHHNPADFVAGICQDAAGHASLTTIRTQYLSVSRLPR
jgi:hypothetical protein